MPATEHGENGGATGAPPSRLAWVVLALPILALLATGAWLGAHEGGYFIRDHGPISLLVTGLLASLAVARVSVTRDIRVSSAVAVTSIAVYAVWTTASISWASDRMEAWREAALTGTYATLVCLVVVLARMRVVPLRSLAAIAVAGPTVVTVAMSFQLVEDRAELFYTGRLLGTLGYFNGQAAFLLLPIWCGVWLAADRRLPSLARGTAVGALTFLAATSLLAQSRGSMLGVAVALIVYLALSPWRFRALVPLAVVAGLVVAALPDLTGVYRSLNDDGDVSRAAVTTAVRAIWVTSLLGALAGTVWAYVDRRLGGLDPLVRELGHGAAGPRRSRMRLLAVPAAALALAAAAGVTFQVRDVGADVQRAVDAVRGPEIEEQGGERARLANLSNNGRFDLWSAAIDVARLDPMRGV
ncbi:MAG: O-antigen polymerase, partial [Thermoleophilia bacterium]|nr:O-antigen polymerase [Thermoleophilia bacterium]